MYTAIIEADLSKTDFHTKRISVYMYAKLKTVITYLIIHSDVRPEA